MGMWSSTLFGSGGAIQWQRWQGTLEILVAAPPPFVLTMLPLTLATASIGLYSVVGDALLGASSCSASRSSSSIRSCSRSRCRRPRSALGLLGLVMASTFVLYRHANAFSNLLEYPVWLVTGLLIPVSLLPGWVEPISWVLAPTWGVQAVREAALGGDPLAAIGMCARARRPPTSRSAGSRWRTSSGSPASARPSR